jgi:hypothetical protein
MSEIKVNKISPKQTCTQVTLGDSGDTFTIPAGVTLTNNGTATGFGPTGAVSWNTTKITADPNPAVSGVGYFADTTSSAFTVTLPAAPSAGDIVALSDYTGTWATNNLTVGRNSSNINGAAADLVLNVNNTTATLIYVDGTEGWRVIDTGSLSEVNVPLFVTATGGTILTCGDYKTHVFTSPGTFTVSCAGNSLGSTTVDYLVVAGGGGGASEHGGGGGAGGYRQNYPSPAIAGLPVTAQGYPITVGGGGAGGAGGGSNQGVNGVPSIFSTITSTGGGTGGTQTTPGAPTSFGSPGGSGGGGGGPTYKGVGNTPPVSPPQGNPGGTQSPTGGNGTSGGGGGAGAAGGDGGLGPSNNGGLGGIGSPIATTVFGPTSPSYGTPGPAPGRYFAGGGGGGPNNGGSSQAGGAGGGGAGGGDSPSVAATAGTANTGGGGGGGTQSYQAGAAGGSGIVVIRYKFQ